MEVFLSYATEERALAERVCRVLESEGHQVFFDRDDLGGGDAFGERIRTAIGSSDVLVYLISRSSVASPSYALTELAIAAALSKRRRPAILPVRTDDTPIDAVPPALRAYTILEPQGDAPAEIAHAVDRLGRQGRQTRVRIAVAVAALLLVAAGLYAVAGRRAAPVAEPPKEAAREAPRDPIEELNAAILDRTPPERRVTLTGMPGNDGWTAVLILADRTVTELFYRLDGDTAFTNTGASPTTNMMTGTPLPNTNLLLAGDFWRRRTIEVKYTDVKGREHGPFELDFDPREQLLRFTKQVLANTSWVEFLQPNRGERLVYFTQLLSAKAALTQIRYSWDSEALDQVWPFVRNPKDVWPANIANDTIYAPVPPTARFITVKVVYLDGSSDTRRFDVTDAR